MMQDLAFAIPGVDEAMGFAEIMKCVPDGRSGASLMPGMSNRWSSRSSSLTPPRPVIHYGSFPFLRFSRKPSAS